MAHLTFNFLPIGLHCIFTELDSNCTTGIGPYMGDQSNSCNGMCGPGCHCWWWICGDCCTHKGCLDHDNYCAKDGYISFSCIISVPLYFTCESHSLENTKVREQRQGPILKFSLVWTLRLAFVILILWCKQKGPCSLLKLFVALMFLLLIIVSVLVFTQFLIKLDQNGGLLILCVESAVNVFISFSFLML